MCTNSLIHWRRLLINIKLTLNVFLTLMNLASQQSKKVSPKVIAQRRKHQVGSIASGERGVCCCDATGNFVPPMTIFEKKILMHPALKNGAFPNSLKYPHSS
ncbi:hypothetical protein JTB14_001341 [Gonioctena quinquepunctata]|nr:hypothetical protein JTB14_001341 [Gonioctena quinquepunctata]